jgi:hypothetical protein
MKYILTGLIVIGLFVAGTAHAEVKGWRMGIGSTTGALELDNNYNNPNAGFSENLEHGDTFVLEAGYDVNKVLGFKGAITRGESTSISVSETGSEYDSTYTRDNVNTNLKLSTDIGYTFTVGNFNIKPYGELGVYAGKREGDMSIEYNTTPEQNYSAEVSTLDRGTFQAIGIRTSYKSIYADLSVVKAKSGEAVMLQENLSSEPQAQLTIGYMF